MRPDLLSSKMENMSVPDMPSREDVDRFKGRLFRTKTIQSQSSIEDDVGEGAAKDGSLKRVLTTFDLISLGVGSCVGTGMYVVAGLVAKNVAGPGAILSFMVAALASILSGVCYGEFGVRVPKTTGSAYMYSYVTVGEFVAFLIGWNLILEYMIGSAAGASAISACFDALGNHSMSNYLEENVGTIIGKTYPDFLGCFICLAMTVVLAAGVKNSVIFNNVLNGINFVVWLFMLIAGFFFMDGSIWRETGFAPYGTSGIFSGAATCFYAFIGFDIIGTTGEEAKTPGRSIPIAIVVSLVMCLIAYVTMTMTLTLMVPYDEIHGDSALIDMFVQVGFGGAKWFIAIGAVASLTVSLLGSMFPMPRVIYAMSRDGLLFGFLSQIHPRTNTPLLATLITGVCSSLLSLVVGLQILVEMMSIGTLLAYTLVTVSVLILRYQPDKQDVEVVHKKLPTIEESPDSETFTSEEDPYANDVQSKENKRKVKDDAHLLSPVEGGEKQNYGSLPFGGAALEGKIAMVRRHSHMWWLRLGFPDDDVRPTEISAKNVIIGTGVLACAEITTCLLLVFGDDNLARGDWWAVILLILFFIWVVACFVFILRQPQNKKKLSFMAPGVPFLPCIAMFFNIYLMFKLPALTWMRLAIWILIGLLMYFGYSMLHSSKEHKQKEMELQAKTVPPPMEGDPDLHVGYEQTDVDQSGFIHEQPSLAHLRKSTAPVQNSPAPPGAPNRNSIEQQQQPHMNGGAYHGRQLDNQMAGQQMAGQQMAGQQMMGQQMTGQQMSGQQMAGQPMAGRQMAGQQRTGHNMSSNQQQNTHTRKDIGDNSQSANNYESYHGYQDDQPRRSRHSSGPNPAMTELDQDQEYSSSRYPFRSNSVSPPDGPPSKSNPFKPPMDGESDPYGREDLRPRARKSSVEKEPYDASIARPRPRPSKQSRPQANNPFSFDQPAEGNW